MSTQQLKGLIVNENFTPICHVKVEFDVDLPQYKTHKGVYSNDELHEVQAPVLMWLDALDLVFHRLVEQGINLKNLRGISGACQQHGSVYWNQQSVDGLGCLNNAERANGELSTILGDSFAWDLSPNWQDHSTSKECQQLEDAVGGADELAKITGSKAHHRFTGPQVLKLKNNRPDIYKRTYRIALVSSFLTSVLTGQHVIHDIGDVCGMNLWDIRHCQWNEKLVGLFDDDGSPVTEKLGPVGTDGQTSNYPVGRIASYFAQKYGVNSECLIVPATGDNPGTILSLPLEPNDVIISLGTSTTALVVTEKYVPSPLYHLFNHPVTDGEYMGMLCFSNGALAREQIRNSINAKYNVSDQKSWEKFNELLTTTNKETNKIGFYFPLSEIIPDTAPTVKRVQWSDDGETCTEDDEKSWNLPDEDALRIIESQALSIRYRLSPMLTTENHQPRRIYFVGGASHNKGICLAISKVLVPIEGSYTLDLTDACATGSAYKSIYGVNQPSANWNDFINSKWTGAKICEGSQNLEDFYGEKAVNMFIKSEKIL